jgi:uncharacterized damage-inducible protein DinB
MSKQISNDVFTAELFDLLDETFENVQGIYLDKGTSFFETLNTISAEEASRPVSANSACIAAIVEHVRYYNKVFESIIQKKTIGKIDWQDCWQLKEVTPAEWEDLKKQLRESYQSVLTMMKNLETWEGEEDIGASLAIVAHTAYHLGAIRQALRVIK